MVEQLAVNQLVVGSNPTWGVYFKEIFKINSQSTSFMFLWANKRIKVSPNFLDSIFNNFLVSFCVAHNGPTSIYFFLRNY